MKTHPTDGFEYDQRVLVNCPGEITNGMQGIVVHVDYDMVLVRLDRITPKMKDFESLKTGVVSYPPYKLIRICLAEETLEEKLNTKIDGLIKALEAYEKQFRKDQ